MSEIQASGYSPTVMKRMLSRKLVELRKSVGMTTTQVCRTLNWSATKLNHIEKGRWVEPNGDLVNDLCELYGVDGRDRDALVQLARSARQRGWWRKYNDVFGSELPGFEAGASMIRTFETVFIPGLLQTPDYIEMITRAAGITDPATVKRHVDARLKRQTILTRDQAPCRLHAVIDETAILRINDKTVRKEQIRHIAQTARSSHVEVQLLRIGDGLYPSSSAEPFSYLSFPDPGERDIVYLETTVDDRMLEEPDELDRYIVRFKQLCDIAPGPDETLDYLEHHLD
jgi:DNA-binding XRE family transcriptional regulator